MRRTLSVKAGALRRTSVLFVVAEPTNKPRGRPEAFKNKGWFAGMKDLAEPENIEKYRGDTPQVSHAADVINVRNFMQKSIGGTRRDLRNITAFLTDDEIAKYMSFKEAARRLGIPEEKLPRLKPEDVERAWNSHFQGASKQEEKRELSVAAEILMDYTQSNVKDQVLKAHNRKVLNDMKLSMEAQAEQKNDRIQFGVVLGLGLVTLGAGFVMMLMVYYYEWSNDRRNYQNMRDNAMDYFLTMTMQKRKNGPPPDYATRYARTQTAYEQHMAESVDSSNMDPRQQDLLRQKEEQDREDAKLNLQIITEVAEELERKEKELRLQNSEVAIIRKEDIENISPGNQRLVLKSGAVVEAPTEFSLTAIKTVFWSVVELALDYRGAVRSEVQ